MLGVRTNSLAMRIASGYAVVIAALIAVVIFTLMRSTDVKFRSEDVARYTVPGVMAGLRLEAGVNQSLSALNGWVNLGDNHFVEARNDAWLNIDEALNGLKSIARSQRNVHLAKDLDALFEDLEQLRHYQHQVESVAQNLDNFPGLKLLETQAVPRMESIILNFGELIELEEGKREVHVENQKALVALANLRHNMLRSIMSIRAYLASNDNRDYETFNQLWDETEDLFQQLKQSDRLTDRQQQIVNDIEDSIERFILLPDQMFDYRQGPEWDLAKLRIEKWIGPLQQKIKSSIRAMISAQKSRLDSDFTSMNTKFDRLIGIGTWMLIGAVLLCSVIGVLLTRMIVRPFEQVIGAANRITEGDFDVSVNIHGTHEAESLRQALNAMTAFLRRIATHAAELARGNFDQDFEPRSDKDKLGHALRQMTIDLRQAQELHATESWLRAGRTGLADALRGVVNVQQLVDVGTEYIATYMGAQVGATYLSNERMAYHLAAQFAFKPDNFEREYLIGEGLVGQAAKDGKIHYVSNLPPDHYPLSVQSGLGSSQASYIAVAPLVSRQDLDAECSGVLALAFDHDLSGAERELLEKVCEYLCVSLLSAKSRARLQTLLDESQQQAEELESQKDELRATNEELEAQAHALQQSKEALRKRSEDLRGNNLLLERQNVAVELKNREVEDARLELERKAAELAQASKYKSEFLANMSHELRSPLNSLLILSESLAKNKAENLTEDQVEDAHVIHDAGETLLLLINDILDLSKVEAGKLIINITSFSLSATITKLVSQFKPIAKKAGLDFRVKCLDDCPKEIRTDQQRFKQILRNLLSNAFKFTHEGSVTLEYGLVALGDPENAESTATQEKLFFCVSDTGIGIPAAMQELVFDAFQQGDGAINRMYNGSGLGLTISRELTALIGGEIDLQSEERHGSQFTLILPLYFDPNDDHRESEEPTNERSHLIEPEFSELSSEENQENIDAPEVSSWILPLPDQRKSVLIAEDDSSFAKTLQEISECHGFRCLLASDGTRALALIMEHKPSAVILDIGLPKMSGLEVLNAIKLDPETRNIPVHIISAQDADHELIKRGAIGFLPKPASFDDLDQVFSKFKTLLRQDIKSILLLGGRHEEYLEVKKLLQDLQTDVLHVTDTSALPDALADAKYDCCILNMDAEEVLNSGWLTQIEPDGERGLPPLIIYTSEALTDAQYRELSHYIDVIVIKGARSPERLKDEVDCFLYSVNAKFPPDFDSLTPSGPSSLAGCKVLLVDDDLRNSYAISRFLKEQEMQIFLADNGELALQKIRDEKHFDLILMDIMMPVMDGYEAIRRIRDEFSTSIPIIALTAKATGDDKNKCLEAGASDYLSKPLAIDRLLAMIRVWLA